MKFFFNPDWFNREGPYAFTLEHFLFIIISTIIGVILAILLKKCQKRTVKIVVISLWAFLIVLEILKWAVIYTRVAIDDTYQFDIETMLPLHSCSMFMYIFPVAMFAKNEKIKTMSESFLVCVNMIMGFITMFVGFSGKHSSVFSFFGLHTLVFHAIIFIVPLIMVVTGLYDIKKWDINYGLLLFLVLAVIIWIFDVITKCDYMYIYDGHTFGVLKIIYENVHHLVWTLITVSSYMITAISIHFLIIYIKHIINKKGTKVN